jgi:hypothetical protein
VRYVTFFGELCERNQLTTIIRPPAVRLVQVLLEGLNGLAAVPGVAWSCQLTAYGPALATRMMNNAETVLPDSATDLSLVGAPSHSGDEVVFRLDQVEASGDLIFRIRRGPELLCYFWMHTGMLTARRTSLFHPNIDKLHKAKKHKNKCPNARVHVDISPQQ